MSPTCPYNMLKFGPLAAEIVSLVKGTPANFNGFRVLAALLHGSLVVGVSQTAALNRGRHLYSAGRASRWALAQILVSSFSVIFYRDSVRWTKQRFSVAYIRPMLFVSYLVQVIIAVFPVVELTIVWKSLPSKF